MAVRYAYDASGMPMAVVYNGTTYYYATNIQGDVVAILNSSGTAVVTYTYDAWGNILTTTGTLASTLGTHNPLRYRGYVYDPETGLYYLQSRYYNPTLARFLNADAFASTGQGLLGNNMFAYCLNNPVNLEDITGSAARMCFSDNDRLDEAPWFDHSPSGGGRPLRDYTHTIITHAHSKSSWLDTDWPSFMLLTNEGAEIISWALTTYSSAYYFDEAETQAINFSAGNIGAYAGMHSENGTGVNAGASLISVGYDGVLFDVSVDFLTAEAMYMYNNGKVSGKFGFGWVGFGYSIDLLAIYENWFGGN